MVVRAQTSSPAAQDALANLCRTYWYPLYAYIRRRGFSPHDAKDFTQGFFLHLVEHQLVNKAERGKGRFRSFLLTCLTNYLKDEWRREAARKRGGAVTIVSIDENEAEDRYLRLPACEPDLDRVFDRTWAATVIEAATEKLRQAYASRGRLEVYEALKRSLSGDLPPAFHVETAARLGMSRATLDINLSRFRGAFGECIRHVIAETVDDPADIQDEIRHLMAAWAGNMERQISDQ